MLSSPQPAGASLWDRTEFPEAIRQLVHLSASEVPAFPQPDSMWKDPRAWPPVFEAVGRRFTLAIFVANRSRDMLTSAKRVADVPPGNWITLSYVNTQGPGPGDLLAGPWFQWDPDGRLVTRTWCEPDTVLYRTSRYRMYPSGKLREYEFSSRKQWPGPDDTLTVLTEYFDEKGVLAGVSYDLFGGGTKQSQWWWDGTPVGAREWEAHRKSFFELKEP